MEKDNFFNEVHKTRKVFNLGHLMRNNKYKILQSILKAQKECWRKKDQIEISWLKNIQESKGHQYKLKLPRTAENREVLEEQF